MSVIWEASHGDILVVESQRRFVRGEGFNRPILPEEERAEILSGLGCVDYVTIFDEPTPLNLISLLLPHILVKGGDWTKEATAGWETVQRTGGEVVILPFVEGSSTSQLIETIVKRYEKK
jgi:D-beta-D-heptose 7-phosphate kinase/D-beta-D-heptose 1-phosphate adenosyltransferase